MAIRTKSDECYIYRKVCNYCNKILSNNAELYSKFSKLTGSQRELFYAKLVVLVAENEITTYWYLMGQMPAIQEMAVIDLRKRNLGGIRKLDSRFLQRVKDKIDQLDTFGIFEGNAFLFNFYREMAPSQIRDLYLAKEDLLREPNCTNFSKFETEVALLRDYLEIPANALELLADFGTLYPSVFDIGLRNDDWLRAYLTVISKYVSIKTMKGPRSDEEKMGKLKTLPKDILKLNAVIEDMQSVLAQKDNARRINESIAV